MSTAALPGWRVGSRHVLVRSAAVAALWLFAGCSGGEEVGALGGRDAGQPADAGALDARTADAQLPPIADAGLADARPEDAAPPVPDDAGPEVDAVRPDDGGIDAAGADVGPADAGPPPEPGPEITAWCGDRPWAETLEPGTAGPCQGEYAGYLEGLDPLWPFSRGVVELMKIVPPHPFRVERIRAQFGGGAGRARFRITTTFGRSYPPTPWARYLENEAVDLIAPVEVEVRPEDAGRWLEVDVRAAGLYLEPTQHYLVLYEHLAQAPFLSLQTVPPGEFSRALLFVPPSEEAYGLSDGERWFNYGLELTGHWLCQLDPAARLFAEVEGLPLAADRSEKVMVVDLNGDGHDDLVTPRPAAYLGDGRSGFVVPAVDPFSAVRAPFTMVFGDVDQDGDPDLFSAPWVSTDRDLDGFEVAGQPPDCDDTEAGTHPGADELDGDGRDNDCDGLADDGLPADRDADRDGVPLGAGDCDDTRPESHPGAAELLDGRDNDCDGRVDEDFVNQLLRNEGPDRPFAEVADSGVAALDPTTVAGFADADADGDPDLYWGNWLKLYPEDAAVPDRFVRNRGDGTFEEATAAAGMELPTPYSPYGLLWSDLDGDGWPDLFVGNYHLYPNQLWHNQGDGTFVDVGEASGVAHDDVLPPRNVAELGLTGGHTYGADAGDFDNDGDLDLYIPNLAHPRVSPWSDRSMFAVNQGGSELRFTNEVRARGLVYDEGDVMAAFGDYDNDGDLDLAVASLYTGHYSRLYRNDGPTAGYTFTDVTYRAGVAVHDAVTVLWADLDEDGWLDLLVADRDAVLPNVHLFRNRGAELAAGDAQSAPHWVELDLVGTTGNREALGARVTLQAGGVTRIREVRGGGGLGSTQHSHRVHFGLGPAATVDAVTVRWVGGADEAVAGLGVDGRYRITQGTGRAELVVPRR